MEPVYLLWDLESRSIVDEFPTEAAALATVRYALQTHGRTYAETFALVRDDATGNADPQTIAVGAQLVDRAVSATSPAR